MLEKFEGSWKSLTVFPKMFCFFKETQCQGFGNIRPDEFPCAQDAL